MHPKPRKITHYAVEICLSLHTISGTAAGTWSGAARLWNIPPSLTTCLGKHLCHLFHKLIPPFNTNHFVLCISQISGLHQYGSTKSFPEPPLCPPLSWVYPPSSEQTYWVTWVFLRTWRILKGGWHHVYTATSSLQS